MKIVYTEDALRDLDDILAFLADHYPSVIAPFEWRLEDLLDNVAAWPESKPLLDNSSGIRVAFLGKYPYRIFYRVDPDQITVLHVHHTARRPWRPADA